MKVQIENLICEWDETTADVFVRFCNFLLLQKNLRRTSFGDMAHTTFG